MDNYREIVRYTHMNGRLNSIELLATSESVNQMIRRAYYLNKLENFKRTKRNEIVAKQQELSGMQLDLERIEKIISL